MLYILVFGALLCPLIFAIILQIRKSDKGEEKNPGGVGELFKYLLIIIGYIIAAGFVFGLLDYLSKLIFGF